MRGLQGFLVKPGLCGRRVHHWSFPARGSLGVEVYDYFRSSSIAYIGPKSLGVSPAWAIWRSRGLGHVLPTEGAAHVKLCKYHGINDSQILQILWSGFLARTVVQRS